MLLLQWASSLFLSVLSVGARTLYLNSRCDIIDTVNIVKSRDRTMFNILSNRQFGVPYDIDNHITLHSSAIVILKLKNQLKYN